VGPTNLGVASVDNRVRHERGSDTARRVPTMETERLSLEL